MLPHGGLYEFNRSITRIKKEFGTDWLESHSDHPLKNLWMEKNVFASIQLHQFGYSLQKIKSLNPKWFDDAIDRIMNKTPGERRGAVLEVLVASQMHCPPNRIVKLPCPGNPGYDLVVKLKDDSLIYYQVKNNSGSEHYNKMKEKARSIEGDLAANLGARALRIRIKTDKDPDAGDWNRLRKQLPPLIDDSSFEGGIVRDIEGGWHIELHNETGNCLHPSKGSYVFQLLTPISQQEKNGISNDITDACNDLEKKEDPDTDESINIAIVCIPLDLPFALGGKWINDYFTEFPDVRVSGVLLYKPGVVTDLEKGGDKFAHAFHLILRKDKEDWIEALSAPNSLDIAVGSGTISIEGKNNWDNYNRLYGGATRESYIENHVYQSGNINYLFNNLGEYRFEKPFNIKIQAFYVDSDRQEKEVPLDFSRDQDLVLLR
jgi:hypothetical protein